LSWCCRCLGFDNPYSRHLRSADPTQDLELCGNQVGDAGATTLAEAIQPTPENSTGALASLKELWMDDGPHGVDHPTLKAACEARGIDLQ